MIVFTGESPPGKYLLHGEGGGGAAPAEDCRLCFGENTTGSLNMEAQRKKKKKGTKSCSRGSKRCIHGWVSFRDACGALVECSWAPLTWKQMAFEFIVAVEKKNKKKNPPAEIFIYLFKNEVREGRFLVEHLVFIFPERWSLDLWPWCNIALGVWKKQDCAFECEFASRPRDGVHLCASPDARHSETAAEEEKLQSGVPLRRSPAAAESRGGTENVRESKLGWKIQVAEAAREGIRQACCFSCFWHVVTCPNTHQNHMGPHTHTHTQTCERKSYTQ